MAGKEPMDNELISGEKILNKPGGCGYGHAFGTGI